MKKCCACKETKSLECFHKSKSKADGVQTQCKVCAKQYKAEYLSKNPDKLKQSWAKYYKNHTHEVMDRVNRWRKANLEKAREVHRKSQWKFKYGAYADQAKELYELQKLLRGVK